MIPLTEVELGLTYPCLLSVPELSMEPAKHQAFLAPGASSFLGQEIAQDDFSLAFRTPEQRPLGCEDPARKGPGSLSHLLGGKGEFLARSMQTGRKGGGREHGSGCHTSSCWE